MSKGNYSQIAMLIGSSIISSLNNVVNRSGLNTEGKSGTDDTTYHAGIRQGFGLAVTAISDALEAHVQGFNRREFDTFVYLTEDKHARMSDVQTGIEANWPVGLGVQHGSEFTEQQEQVNRDRQAIFSKSANHKDHGQDATVDFLDRVMGAQ